MRSTPLTPLEMPSLNLDGYARRVIQHRANRLARSTASDQHDIEQELWLDLVKRWPRFDANRACERTFAARVVNHHAVKLRTTQSTPLKLSSLHETVKGEDGRQVPLAETVDDQSQARRTGRPIREGEDLADLRSDVLQTIAGLPNDLRDLCERLKSGSISEVARDLGITRAAIYRKLTYVRSHFERAGLRNYL